MQYISFIVLIILLLTITASAIIAFIIRRNWSSITMIISIFLLLIFIAGNIYLSQQMYKSAMSQAMNAEVEYQNMKLAIEIIGYTCAPLFIIGLIGFINSSASVYSEADTLQRANQKLSAKLNQL